MRIKHRQEELVSQGIMALQQLKQLVVLFQQHRGKSTAYLKGDSSQKPEVVSLQKAIQQKMKGDSKVNDLLKQLNDWKDVEHHWQGLSRNYSSLKAEENFKLHSQLIQATIDLWEDLYFLYLDNIKSTVHTSTSTSTLIEQPGLVLLLRSGELIGQLRGLGTGVAASGSCASADKIRLQHLCEQVEGTLIKVPDSTHLQSGFKTLQGKVIEGIAINQPNYDATGFFAEATQVLNQLYSHFDQVLAKQKSARN
jgi:HPt (histidine-containing phosphotransfer) domain-containing protein